MAIEKIGRVNNPLTIIAIFAMIAEVSSTVTIGLVNNDLQNIFIWFVIGFPSFLVVSFFLTLNLNPKVLYAPGDYKEEGNFIKMLYRPRQDKKSSKKRRSFRLFKKNQLSTDEKQNTDKKFQNDQVKNDDLQGKREGKALISDGFKVIINQELSAPAFYSLIFIIYETKAKNERDLLNSNYEKYLPIGWDHGLTELINLGLVVGSISDFSFSEVFTNDIELWVGLNHEPLKDMTIIFNRALYNQSKGDDNDLFKIDKYYSEIKFE